MRFLADENFPGPIVDLLRRKAHDVIWARTHFSGWTDSDLIDQAEADGRLILTLDNDFWQIALQRRQPLEFSGVILFRVHPAIPAMLEPLVHVAFNVTRDWAGHVSIVTPKGIEMLPVRRH
jgi:predicted nuclease of predicted toxin-antitoxin system